MSDNLNIVRIQDLEDELDLKDKWVKHHQKSVENCFTVRNKMQGQIDSAVKLIRELNETYEFQLETMRDMGATMVNSGIMDFCSIEQAYALEEKVIKWLKQNT